MSPVIERANLGVVHHILVYTCQLPVAESPVHRCYNPNMPENATSCSRLTFSWAIGGEVMMNSV